MKKQIPNLICTIGLALICVGLWRAWPPAAWITLGVFTCFLGVLLLKKQNPPSSPPQRRDLF